MIFGPRGYLYVLCACKLEGKSRYWTWSARLETAGLGIASNGEKAPGDSENLYNRKGPLAIM
jgi:hypothetical protein